MAWICLLAAGCLEMVWVTAMKLSDGFTRVGYSVLTVAAMAAQRLALGPGGEDLAHGDSVRRLDRNWRPGCGGAGNCDLQRASHRGPDVFRGPAARRHHWSESNGPLREKTPASAGIFLVGFSPGFHGVQNRPEAAPQVGEGVLHAGGNLRVDGADEQSAGLPSAAAGR